MTMSGLITFFVAVAWLCNTQFLNRFYIYNKKNDLIKTYQVINALYKSEAPGVGLKLEKLEFTRWLHIIILDSQFEEKYDSFFKEGEWRPRRKRSYQKPPALLVKDKVEAISKKKILIEVTGDNRLNINFIDLFSSLDNGDYILLRTPMEAIEESVSIANRFFLFTGIITIIIGSLLVFILTGRFTKPILDLNGIAQRMSLLDFSQKYIVKTRDEVGELGKSINSLSEQLEKSIGELQDANQRLQQDIERERKIDKLRKEFISNVSHELKTPIALIQGYAEGLMVNVNEDEDNKNFYAGVIVDEALKMNKLVKQLLDLSQMESGYFNLDKVKFSIIQLVEEVLKKNALVFQDKKIYLIFNQERDFLVKADYDQMEKVITNYIGNAVNHVDQARIIKIKIGREGDKVRVTVFNSGPHIPEIYFDKIWTSFYKIDNARTREYGGSGLGLSIVRAILEAHRNGYGVQNVPGGVEFRFDLDWAEE